MREVRGGARGPAAPLAPQVQRVLKWVNTEENRSNLLVAGTVDRVEEEEEKQQQLKRMVDWKDFGIAALYSEQLHLLPDDFSAKMTEPMSRSSLHSHLL